MILILLFVNHILEINKLFIQYEPLSELSVKDEYKRNNLFAHDSTILL